MTKVLLSLALPLFVCLTLFVAGCGGEGAGTAPATGGGDAATTDMEEGYEPEEEGSEGPAAAATEGTEEAAPAESTEGAAPQQ